MISYAQQKLTCCYKKHNKIIRNLKRLPLFLALTLFISIPSSFAFELPNPAIQYTQTHYGAAAVNRLVAWQNLINNNQKDTELEKLRAVTDFFNAIPYQSDQQAWHTQDFWANPLEFISKDAGDCEDYAIAKYLTLKAMGVPSNKMRIVYVVSSKINIPHMILAYYATTHSQPLILDSMTPEILYASDRPDLRPVYMFSENAIWFAQPPKPPKEVISGVQIHGWKELITRMQKEGLTEDDLTP